jgi:hypothetical protein
MKLVYPNGERIEIKAGKFRADKEYPNTIPEKYDMNRSYGEFFIGPTRIFFVREKGLADESCMILRMNKQVRLSGRLNQLELNDTIRLEGKVDIILEAV